MTGPGSSSASRMRIAGIVLLAVAGVAAVVGLISLAGGGSETTSPTAAPTSVPGAPPGPPEVPLPGAVPTEPGAPGLAPPPGGQPGLAPSPGSPGSSGEPGGPGQADGSGQPGGPGAPGDPAAPGGPGAPPGGPAAPGAPGAPNGAAGGPPVAAAPIVPGGGAGGGDAGAGAGGSGGDAGGSATAARSVPVHVLNNSVIPGLAQRAADQLGRSGWNVVEVGNLPNQLIPRSVVLYQGGGDEAAARSLASQFGIEVQAGGDKPGLTVVATQNWPQNFTPKG